MLTAVCSVARLCSCAQAAALLPNVTSLALSYNYQPVVSGVVTSIFSPNYLCSSAPCKQLTADTMALISAGSSLAGELAGYLTFSSIEWCPAEGAGAGTTVKQTFTVAGDVASFGASQQLAFKRALVTQLNAGITNDWSKVTVGQVALAVSSASLSIEASIATSSDTVKSSISASMTTLASAPTATLSAALGVSVEAVAAPTETVVVEQEAAPVVGLPGSGGGISIVVIVAAAGGAVFLLVVLIFVKVCLCKKKSGDGKTTGTV